MIHKRIRFLTLVTFVPIFVPIVFAFGLPVLEKLFHPNSFFTFFLFIALAVLAQIGFFSALIFGIKLRREIKKVIPSERNIFSNIFLAFAVACALFVAVSILLQIVNVLF